MRLISAFSVCAVIASAAAAAAENSSPKADSSQRIMCRTAREIGSMISHRECHTRAEWDQMAADAKESLDNRPRRWADPSPDGPDIITGRAGRGGGG